MARFDSLPRPRFLRAILVLAVLFSAASTLGVYADPIKIESGLISGIVLGEDQAVRAYKGIPYAAPPVGDLRWKPPQRPGSWDGIRECTEYGPPCPQSDVVWRFWGEEKPERMSEDCLYLNVWTSAKHADDKLPVMVWIHGGAFTLGWGNQRVYDGEALSRKGVVVVTINYRLGAFGFFAHPLLSKESGNNCSGNYGLLDQIAALRWVRDNITAFGGDSDRITIFGESAGATSVNCLCISPLGKGLFHRAISQSGGFTYWDTDHLRETSPSGESLETMGERLAEEVLEGDPDDILAALRAVPAEQLIPFASGGGYRFRPAVDGWVLPDYPPIMYKKRLQHDIPMILGTNSDEATMFAGMAQRRSVDDHRADIEKQYGEFAPKILKLYPVETKSDVYGAFCDHFADTVFIGPTRAMIRSMDKSESNAYLYHFTRKSQDRPEMGAFHSMEMAYVFNNLDENKAQETDLQLSDAMSTYWVQFAATGDPNGNGLPAWPVYDTESDKHLELGDTIREGSGLHKRACDVLDGIMEQVYIKFAGTE